MNKLDILKRTLVNKTGRVGLKLQKYSPEISLGLGIIGFAGTVVLASKATLKIESVLDDAKTKLDQIDYVLTNRDEFADSADYTEEDSQKDRALVYIQTGVKIVKLYGPALALGTLSIAAFLNGHKILKKRNLAIAAAYKAAEESFKDYRTRVATKYGKDIEHQLRHGILSEDVIVEEKDEETGKTKKIKKVKLSLDPNHLSQYARFYDDGNKNWSPTPEFNLVFLRSQQAFANDMLHTRGHLFLNEVYDMLGIPRHPQGQVVGWLLDENGDNYVDFGIYAEQNMDFVNGYENVALLDFNVDGLIFESI